jgi:predicted signal transduction protein with EAL and GGDEF domain
LPHAASTNPRKPAGCLSARGAGVERLVARLAEPFDLDIHQAAIGVSIGIAMLPGDGEDADTALKNADLALYRAKVDGRGTFRFFEPGMDAAMQRRSTLVRDLRRGLETGQFELFYQPILDKHAVRIQSFEALIRWRHPERGLVLPAEFIPVTEEIGLIRPLGAWVLAKACADAMQWPGRISVAVNLSSVQFINGNLLQEVRRALRASGLPPHRLELEVTEAALIQNSQATLALLNELKALGVSVALDDFGAGHSSLGYLRKFPFDRVKIDKSFIQDLRVSGDAIAIVRSVTRLCRALDIATTAEGVETAQQFDGVQANGCTDVQGYLFSPPVPAAEIPALCGKLEPQRMTA